MPFIREEGQGWDFSAPSQVYFDRAAEMLSLAAAQGFTPALVLMWGELVPGNSINITYHTHPMKKSVPVKLGLGEYDITAINLEHRCFEVLPVKHDVETSVIGMTQRTGDVVVIGEKQ